ncbi:MAG: hypothetical protein V7646_1058 [Pseudonocardia sp.]
MVADELDPLHRLAGQVAVHQRDHRVGGGAAMNQVTDLDDGQVAGQPTGCAVGAEPSELGPQLVEVTRDVADDRKAVRRALGPVRAQSVGGHWWARSGEAHASAGTKCAMLSIRRWTEEISRTAWAITLRSIEDIRLIVIRSDGRSPARCCISW